MSPVLADAQRNALADIGCAQSLGPKPRRLCDRPRSFSPTNSSMLGQSSNGSRPRPGGRWRGVGLDAAGNLCFTTVPDTRTRDDLDAQYPDAPLGAIVETQRPERLAEAFKLLAQDGPVAALIIDYGHATPVSGDTLQAVRGHRLRVAADVARRSRSIGTNQLFRIGDRAACGRPRHRRPRHTS